MKRKRGDNWKKARRRILRVDNDSWRWILRVETDKSFR